MARAICLRQLTAAPRTRAQLAATLATRLVPPEVAASVLDRFTDVGLVDDAAYAEAWVRSRHRSRGLATPVLRRELEQRGVGAELVATALSQLDPDDERAAARRLVERKAPVTAALPRDVRLRRLTAMLARKGYGAGVAFSVVREVIDGADAPEDGRPRG